MAHLSSHDMKPNLLILANTSTPRCAQPPRLNLAGLGVAFKAGPKVCKQHINSRSGFVLRALSSMKIAAACWRTHTSILNPALCERSKLVVVFVRYQLSPLVGHRSIMGLPEHLAIPHLKMINRPLRNCHHSHHTFLFYKHRRWTSRPNPYPILMWVSKRRKGLPHCHRLHGSSSGLALTIARLLPYSRASDWHPSPFFGLARHEIHTCTELEKLARLVFLTCLGLLASLMLEPRPTTTSSGVV